MLIQLWADEDRTPPWSGEVRFHRRRKLSQLHIHVDADARRQYTEAFDRFAASIKTVAFRNDGKYAGLPTSMPLDEAIFGSLARIRSLA